MKNGFHYMTGAVIAAGLGAVFGCGAWPVGDAPAYPHEAVKRTAPAERWELYWASVPGAEQHRLTPPPMDGRSLAWSPDGTKLAFVMDRDGND